MKPVLPPSYLAWSSQTMALQQVVLTGFAGNGQAILTPRLSTLVYIPDGSYYIEWRMIGGMIQSAIWRPCICVLQQSPELDTIAATAGVHPGNFSRVQFYDGFRTGRVFLTGPAFLAVGDSALNAVLTDAGLPFPTPSAATTIVIAYRVLPVTDSVPIITPERFFFLGRSANAALGPQTIEIFPMALHEIRDGTGALISGGFVTSSYNRIVPQWIRWIGGAAGATALNVSYRRSNWDVAAGGVNSYVPGVPPWIAAGGGSYQNWSNVAKPLPEETLWPWVIENPAGNPGVTVAAMLEASDEV